MINYNNCHTNVKQSLTTILLTSEACKSVSLSNIAVYDTLYEGDTEFTFIS